MIVDEDYNQLFFTNKNNNRIYKINLWLEIKKDQII
jgi:hypothetical protein